MKLRLQAKVFDLNGMSLWTGLYTGIPTATPKSAPGIYLKGDTTSENILFRLAMEEGLMIQSYKSEKQGALIHNIIPVPGKEDSLSNEGSGEFPMHVEAPQREDRPDFLALLCLRGEVGACTRWSHITDIYGHLRPETVTVLSQAEFALEVGESWSDQERFKVIPILDRKGQIRVNMAKVQPLTKRAHVALQCLREALAVPGVIKDQPMEPGTLLLLNNRTCVHGRAPFKSSYDGAHRWLQRAYYRWPCT